MTLAIIPGSFDPITNGHMFLIKEAYNMFDHVLIAIGKNTEKSGYLEPEERAELVKAVCKVNCLERNLEVQVYDGTLANLVNYYMDLCPQVVIFRGVRNATDLAYEASVKDINSLLGCKAQTFFILNDIPELRSISSSFVRSLIGKADWWYSAVEKTVPLIVAAYLRNKWAMNELSSQNIPDNYLDVNRPYHGAYHIYSMLKKYNEIPYGDCRDDLEYTILIHDIIYNPRSNTNEKDSLTVGLDFADPEVERLVRSTQIGKKHRRKDEKLLHDLDYMILGAPWEEYYNYERLIRLEYSHLNDEEYANGRISFLENLIQNGVFETKEFVAEYEAQALENMKRSLATRVPFKLHYCR